MAAISPTPFPLGAYLGNANGNDPTAEINFEADAKAFSTLMAAQPQFIDAYVDQTKSIDQWISNAGWAAWSSALSPVAKTMTPVIGLPMISTAAGSPSADQFYKNFAAGNYDSVIQGVVKAWSDQGFKTQYWRPGWEMNLSSMPSYAGSDAATQADWVKAFQHISTVLHAAGQADGVNLQVIWNPGTTNYSNAGVATQTLYPGNQYVDIIGADVYGDLYPYGTPTALYDWDKSGQVLNSSKPVFDSSLQQWAADPINLKRYYTYPAATQWSLDGSVAHSLSLQNLIDFAKAQGKPIAVPETGAGNTADGAGVSDNPAFVQWLSSTLTNAGVPVKFVNIWDSNGGGNYEFSLPTDNKPNEAAAWAQYFGATAAAATVTIGSGPDTLALSMAEDAWQGDARFTVSVDGKQIAGTQTATASHGTGNSQVFDILGSFGAGAHTATVNFLNDAYGGTATTDRNLYVTGATIDGAAIANGTLTLLSGGPQSFSFNGAAASPADTLDLHLSEDAWQGAAQFTIAVDGTPVGGVQTATASHAAGATQDFVFAGHWGAGSHVVGITFINDAWGGSAATDRNLYIDQVTYDSRAIAGTPVEMFVNGTANFTVPTAPNPATVTLHLAEDAWQGDAQYAVTIDGNAIGQTGPVTASNAQGLSQAVTLQAVLSAGPHDLSVSFLNDAYGGTPAMDRNLYVKGIDLNGISVTGATATLMSSGSTHFSIVVP